MQPPPAGGWRRAARLLPAGAGRTSSTRTAQKGPAAVPPARLRPGDLAGLASIGLRTRKLRAALSALGIAIGVAAIVAVLGLAASSKAALLAQESPRLGTNLLTVTNGQTFSGGTAELPVTAPGMIEQAAQHSRGAGHRHRRRRQRLQVPLHPRDQHQRRHHRGRHHRLARRGQHQPRSGPVPERGDRPPAGRGAQPPPPRNCWAWTGSGPGSGSGPAVSGFTWLASSKQATLAPEIDSAVLVGFPAAPDLPALRRPPVGGYTFRTVEHPGRHHRSR